MKKLKFLILGASLVSSVSILSQTQSFVSQGTNAFVVPPSVISLKAECVGGGGAGGRVTPSNPFDNDAAGGGGGGAYAAGIIQVIGSQSYDVTVGEGGVNNGSSTNGVDSFFGDGTVVLAAGGTTRSGNDEVAGAAGGQASSSLGTTTFSGGDGGNANEGDSNGGGGGGAAGSNGDGFDGSEITGGGSQANYGGYGGQGGPDGAVGSVGGQYGGGGGGSSANGSSDRNGGSGASGIVVLTWCEVSNFSPATICADGTSPIVIEGTNFVDVDSVTIGSVSLPFTLDNSTQITATITNDANTSAIIVHTQNGSASTITPLTVINNTISVAITGLNELSAVYSGGNGATYQWLDCANSNAPISNYTNESEVFNQVGIYSVEVTENGCTVTSDCFVFNSLEVNEQNKNDFVVYPNPVVNTFKIESNNKIDRTEIIDLNGKVITVVSQSNVIDMSAFENGIYIVKVYSGVDSWIGKIVKN